MKPEYIIITEAALDALLVTDALSVDSVLPNESGGVFEFSLGEFVGYRTVSESDKTAIALIGVKWLELLQSEGARPQEIYRRLARVVKGMRSPPVHLPRQWFEYHYRNYLAFFALPRELSSSRWVVEFGKSSKIVRFDFLTFSDSEVDLTRYSPADWPSGFENAVDELLKAVPTYRTASLEKHTFSRQVDLEAIGSSSIVNGLPYEAWEGRLTESQVEFLAQPLHISVRLIGPAGSGKTLALCMKALKAARDVDVQAQGKRILIATHSWAMSERIDGVLHVLNGGVAPSGVTVFPLLSLLEFHAGHIGQRKIDVIGDDSTDGRLKSLEIIHDVLELVALNSHDSLSPWILDGMRSASDSRSRLELVVTLYEEMSGILTASGVAPDDHESIREYINSKREDWMPPFDSAIDRGFVISVYKLFIQQLIDRSAITTDQFIIDSIRVLETFTWRMRKETEGYDYIFVDELQLFDPQERSALELLGRQRTGVPFITAEDPSQGVFSTLNSRTASVNNPQIYLDTVHRFNREIYDFISFVYHKFPLNALQLKIGQTKAPSFSKPKLFNLDTLEDAVKTSAELVKRVYDSAGEDQRICVVTLGDVDTHVLIELERAKLPVTRLTSFDDVERLAYTKRSIVLAPWEFVGGTQFSHVIVLAFGILQPTSQFGRLREMISIYLSCSRAAETLNIIVQGYTPDVIAEAFDGNLLIRGA